MSVINKMLRDLDKRGATPAAGEGIPTGLGTPLPEAAERGRGKKYLWLAVIPVVIVAAWLGVEPGRTPPATEPATKAPAQIAQAPAVPQPAPAPAAAEPKAAETQPAPPPAAPESKPAEEKKAAEPASQQPKAAEPKPAAQPPVQVAAAPPPPPPVAKAVEPAPAKTEPALASVPKPAAAPALKPAPKAEKTPAPKPEPKAEKAPAPLPAKKTEATAKAAQQPAAPKPAPKAEAVAQAAPKPSPPKAEKAPAPKPAPKPETVAQVAPKPAPPKAEEAPAPTAAPAPAPAPPKPSITVDRKASSTTGEQAAAEYRRAVESLRDGRTDSAMEGFSAALRLDPKHAAARQALVALLVQRGRKVEAQAALQEGMRSNPGNTGWAMLLARLQVDAGDLAGASRTLDESLAYARNQPDYHAFTGTVLQMQGRHREALAHYEAAVQLAPSSARILAGYAMSLEEEKRGAEASAAYQRALASGTLPEDLRRFVDSRLAQLR